VAYEDSQELFEVRVDSENIRGGYSNRGTGITAMNPLTLDYYSGVISPGKIYARNGIRVVDVGFARLMGVAVQISAFPKLHVDVWLSTPNPMGKEGWGVFAMTKTGGSGVGRMFFPVDMWLSGPVYVNCWSHNMEYYAADWHVSVELWYQ